MDGGLACWGPWGGKESDKTEQLNWTEVNWSQTKLEKFWKSFKLRECAYSCRDLALEALIECDHKSQKRSISSFLQFSRSVMTNFCDPMECNVRGHWTNMSMCSLLTVVSCLDPCHVLLHVVAHPGARACTPHSPTPLQERVLDSLVPALLVSNIGGSVVLLQKKYIYFKIRIS